ncbi:DUF89-domain-containing protein [Neocallimastix lanati (nom. inval.)]|jgi:hypothetical protein|uniref:Sugar phosphate phosphatase n=1 Tax=Neocallimastix californiae TaxID=1754190 RepID=A0A1Y2CYV6_9FUNG|nr:DUF89-domain-containing protein [Neocallimastix sp. JGI-2020a]ORY52200.1 DUF89-domain-containing protein [Neocallimastix californiae]|eukprot:ORY52200.1 DUF89-domain-containing protein [Neocallimastix californiae]
MNDSLLPPKPLLRGIIPKSFAEDTFDRRIPDIFTQVVKNFEDALSKVDPSENEKLKEGKEIKSKLEKLVDDIINDREFNELNKDEYQDCEEWNNCIKYWKNKNEATYKKCSWLFSESYLYRVLANYFSISKYWKNYDSFTVKKEKSLIGETWKSVVAMADMINPLIKNTDDNSVRETFISFLKYSLWGNQADLSLHTNAKIDLTNLHKITLDEIKKSDNNLISDESSKIWDYVSTIHGKRFDFILDNAGYETYNDLVFADWLMSKGFASQIVWHCKQIPWYVSDTNIKDFKWIIDTCINPPESLKNFDNTNVIEMAKRWKTYIENNQWVLNNDIFWTSNYPFWHMATFAPKLYEYLSDSSLLIFKGDMNYRKTVYDCYWPFTTPFIEACGNFGQPVPITGKPFPPFACLRTCKADVITGLKEGVSERLDKECKEWLVNGKYGIIQFNDKYLNLRK